VVDGVTLQANNRVLVRAQSNAAQNGIYFVSTLGNGSNGTWTRTSDANQTGEMYPGMVVMVTEGVTYADTPWKLITNGEIVIGTTELTFEQFSSTAAAGGANTDIQFNNNGSFAGSSDLTWNGSELAVVGSIQSGNILPTANNTFSLGNATSVWTDLYLSNSTIYLGEATISASGANLLLPASVHVGNVVLTDVDGNLVMPDSMAIATLAATDRVISDLFIANTGNITLSAAAGNNSVILVATGTGVVDVGNVKIANLLDPAGPQDAATKVYVDNLVARGIHFHQPVQVEAPLNLVATYNNGTDGVGATLTNSGTQAALVIDGITVSVADRVLIYEQTDQTQNGVYVVTDVGSASTNWILTRASDADTYEIDSPEGLSEGSTFFVQQGVTGAGETYTCNTVGVIIFGTTNITFTQISSAQIYSAGTGLTLTGTTFSVNNTQSQITSVGTLDSLSVTGNVTADYFIGNGSQLTGLPESYSNANVADYLPTYTGNLVSLQGNITTTANISGSYILGNGSQLTGLPEGYGNANVADYLPTYTGNLVSLTGAVITTGNITGGNLITAGSVSLSLITKTGSNGVGNIGSVDSTFDTVFAKATSAQYADLAEIYSADQQYPAGTVVIFGGNSEITQSLAYADPAVAGVISTDPAYIMNSSAAGQPVALQGRVPCKVVGNIAKGDLITSSQIPGTATRLDPADWRPGSVIGKALEHYNSTDVGTIEVVVGRV